MRGECQRKLLIGWEKQFTLTLFLPYVQKRIIADKCAQCKRNFILLYSYVVV